MTSERSIPPSRGLVSNAEPWRPAENGSLDESAVTWINRLLAERSGQKLSPNAVDESLLADVYDAHCEACDRFCRNWLDSLSNQMKGATTSDDSAARIDSMMRESEALLQRTRRAGRALANRSASAVWPLLRHAYEHEARLLSAERLYHHAVTAERLAGRLATLRTDADLVRFGTTVAALKESLDALNVGPDLERATADMRTILERSRDHFQQGFQEELAIWLQKTRSLPSGVIQESAYESFPWPGIHELFGRCGRDAAFRETVVRLTAASIHRQMQEDALTVEVDEAIEALLSGSQSQLATVPETLYPWMLISKANAQAWTPIEHAQVQHIKSLTAHLPSALTQMLDLLRAYGTLWQRVVDAPTTRPHANTLERNRASLLQPSVDDASTRNREEQVSADAPSVLIAMLYHAVLCRLWTDLAKVMAIPWSEISLNGTSPASWSASELHSLCIKLYTTMDMCCLQLMQTLSHMLRFIQEKEQQADGSDRGNKSLQFAVSKLIDLCLLPMLAALYHAGSNRLAPETWTVLPDDFQGDARAQFAEPTTPDERGFIALDHISRQLDALRQRFGQRPPPERSTGISAAIGLLAQMGAAMARLRRRFCTRQRQTWNEWLERGCGLCLYGTLLPSIRRWLEQQMEHITGALHSVQELVKPSLVQVSMSDASDSVGAASLLVAPERSAATSRGGSNDHTDQLMAMQTVFELLHELASWTLDLLSLIVHLIHSAERLRETQRISEQLDSLTSEPLGLVGAACDETSAMRLAVRWALTRDAALRTQYFADLRDTNHPLWRFTEKLVHVVAPVIVEGVGLLQSLVRHMFAASLQTLETMYRRPSVNNTSDYDTALALPTFSAHPTDAMIGLGERLLALPSLLEPMLLATRSALHLRCLVLPRAADATVAQVWATHLQQLAQELYRDPEAMHQSMHAPVPVTMLAAGARHWLPLLVEPIANTARQVLQRTASATLSDEQQMQLAVDMEYLEQALERIGCR